MLLCSKSDLGLGEDLSSAASSAAKSLLELTRVLREDGDNRCRMRGGEPVHETGRHRETRVIGSLKAFKDIVIIHFNVMVSQHCVT